MNPAFDALLDALHAALREPGSAPVVLFAADRNDLEELLVELEVLQRRQEGEGLELPPPDDPPYEL